MTQLCLCRITCRLIINTQGKYSKEFGLRRRDLVCLFVLHGFKSLEEMHYRKQQQELILKGVTLPLHLPTVVNTVQQKKRDPKKFHLSAGLVNQTGSAVLKRSWMFFFSIFSFSVTLSVTVTAGGTVSVCRPHSGSSPLLLQ